MEEAVRKMRIKAGRRTDIRRAREEAILAAAEKVFAEAGFGGATMQLIADMAGMPKANLHYYFATKEDLVAAAHGVLMAGLTEAAAARLDELPDDPLTETSPPP